MEKSHTDFLQECAAELAALKQRIAALEEKLAAYEEAPVPEEDAVDFTDIEIGADEAPAPAQPEPEAEPVAEAAVVEPEPEAAPPVILPEVKNLLPDDDTAKMPWRTALPGLRVKNIRSGISLYDRALFVASLFKEDAALYDKTIGTLNEMGSLNEAVAYIRANFPEWDLKSDGVYHFIMAIRKKLG